MPSFRNMQPESRRWSGVLRWLSRRWSGALGRLGAVAGVASIALSVGGCDERVLATGVTYQHVKGEIFGFEPLPEPAPSPIRPLANMNPDYPLLSTVPMRPPNPPTPAERKAAMDRLAADRAAGRVADDALKGVAPPPLPVPPAPAGVPPGKAGGGAVKPADKGGSPGL